MEHSDTIFSERYDMHNGASLYVQRTSYEFCDDKYLSTAMKMSRTYKELFDRLLKNCMGCPNEKTDSLNKYSQSRFVLVYKVRITYQNEQYVSILADVQFRHGIKNNKRIKFGTVFRKRDGKLCPSKIFGGKKFSGLSYILDESGQAVTLT